MPASKDAPRPLQPPKIPFAEKAQKAVHQAQRTAARENARYGPPLVVEKMRRSALPQDM